MICPECGSEYREGFVHCNSCDVDLVQPEPDPGEPDVKLVKVYETGNAAIIPLFESLLQAANIEFMTKSETIQDMFGMGRIGATNQVTGPVEFFVREDASEEARAIADSLSQTEIEGVEPTQGEIAGIEPDENED